MNALVEATPISGPARVNSTNSDSRTIELSATLQIVKRRQVPGFLSGAQSRERVGGLAGLRDRDEQRPRRDHGIAVAIFAREFDARRNAADLLEEIAGNETGVIARSAGGDVHGLDLREHGVRGGSERGVQQAAAGNALLERLGYRARLLVDLLEHEMPVLAALDRVGGQVAFPHGSRDFAARRLDDANRLAADFGDVALLEKQEPPRHGQQRGDVRGDEILVDAEADDDRTARAREHDAVGVALADDRERIGALQFGDGLAYGAEQVVRVHEVMVNAVRDDLGVGLGAEAVAQILELGAQQVVILDDAVVHDGDAVPRHVRMRVAHRGNAVRRPARMRDADVARDRRLLDSLLQHFDLADRAQPGQRAARIDDRKARRIVAAIFEAPQSLEQDRNDITLGDDTYDSTHEA